MSKENEIITLLVFGTLIMLLLSGFVLFFVYMYRQRQIQNVKEQDDLKAVHEQEKQRIEIEIQEQTLQTVAKELHDNIGQVASLLKMNIANLETKDNLPLQDFQSFSLELSQQLIRDIKALSLSLDSEYIQKTGWQKAVEEEIIRWNRLGKLQIQAQFDAELIKSSHEQEKILFRLIQEILHNTFKHAKAENLFIRTYNADRMFVLETRDDGVGFTPEALLNNSSKHQGAGLRNLKERTHMLGGTFELKSTPGNGTQINIQLPLA